MRIYLGVDFLIDFIPVVDSLKFFAAEVCYESGNFNLVVLVLKLLGNYSKLNFTKAWIKLS